jgi:four helix bundle protein
VRLLKNEIKELTCSFSVDEKYRFTNQIIRSSRSINSSIAEGHGRFIYKDRIHYCIVARGSLSETYNHLIDALGCNYINQDKLENYKEK